MRDSYSVLARIKKIGREIFDRKRKSKFGNKGERKRVVTFFCLIFFHFKVILLVKKPIQSNSLSC
jgi:hypothetical protein